MTFDVAVMTPSFTMLVLEHPTRDQSCDPAPSARSNVATTSRAAWGRARRRTLPCMAASRAGSSRSRSIL